MKSGREIAGLAAVLRAWQVAMLSAPRVTYFTMEYAVHSDLPSYAGGLSELAGTR